ncbi:MAG: helix-turn-helix domain-containing protein [Promethearchaeota archaeon]
MIHFLQKSYLKPIAKESKEKRKITPKIKTEMAMELLQGKTLQVYWYIFTHTHARIREIQKTLKFSSSGTVAYQITKLLDAGVISKDESEGKYFINKDIKIGVLKFFIRIRNRMIPRITLYLIIYILGFVVYLILAFIQGIEFVTNPLSLFLLIFLIIGTMIFVIESYKIWKLNPTK